MIAVSGANNTQAGTTVNGDYLTDTTVPNVVIVTVKKARGK